MLVISLRSLVAWSAKRTLPSTDPDVPHPVAGHMPFHGTPTLAKTARGTGTGAFPLQPSTRVRARARVCTLGTVLGGLCAYWAPNLPGLGISEIKRPAR